MSLIEELELRDIYEPNLPGLYKHCFVIDKLIEHNVLDLHKHFVSLQSGFSLELAQHSRRDVCFRLDILPLFQRHSSAYDGRLLRLVL